MANPKLLVIDDDLMFSEMLSVYFRSVGFDVRTADNVEDAIREFRRLKPKVVLLDFNMPLVNGDKFLPLLQDINPVVKIIVVSGYTQEDVEDKFKGLGYFAFFEKGGISLENLKMKVDEALSY